MAESTFATGQCLCGKVTLDIKAEPLRMAQCHCNDCSRSTGTGHMVLAFFPIDKVMIEGETSSYTTVADNGAEITRHFCPECGSRLFGRNNTMTSITSVSAGCLNDSSWFKPAAIVYHKRKKDWDFIDESLPRFESAPPPPPSK